MADKMTLRIYLKIRVQVRQTDLFVVICLLLIFVLLLIDGIVVTVIASISVVVLVADLLFDGLLVVLTVAIIIITDRDFIVVTHRVRIFVVILVVRLVVLDVFQHALGLAAGFLSGRRRRRSCYFLQQASGHLTTYTSQQPVVSYTHTKERASAYADVPPWLLSVCCCVRVVFATERERASVSSLWAALVRSIDSRVASKWSVALDDRIFEHKQRGITFYYANISRFIL